MPGGNVPLEPILARGARELGLELAVEVQQKLLAFIDLLAKWNRVYNLTAVRDLEQMVVRHVLDSLSILPHLDARRALDIGTGAGLPGIPLALARPELGFTLLDSNSKKIRFVTQAVHDLGLNNVEVVHARVENFAPAERFPVLVARAFDAIPDMLARCRHLAAPGGRLFAMKGGYPRDEILALGDRRPAPQVKTLKVPGLDAARHLIIINLD